jgi:magnesium transporter
MAYRLFARRAQKAGMPPGALVYLGDHAPQKPCLYAIVYDESHFESHQVQTLEEALALKEKGKYLWLNIDGLQDTALVTKIGERFAIHPLALEDILNAEQRPKREQFDEFLLVIVKAVQWSAENKELNSEQISLVLGKDYVISFQEKVGDQFAQLKTRLQTSTNRLRKNGPDYLMYAMLDVIVDNYFVVLEQFGEQLDLLEHQIVNNPEPSSLTQLYSLKRAALFVRRATWPLREALGFLQYGESSFVKKSTLPFLRDVYSHTVEAIDTVEIFRETLSSMLDIYLSSASNRLNIVIKVLTIMTTIFMPLSLIAGIYGMNFDHMPELHWTYGYPFALGLMLAVTLGMLIIFRVKRWL